VLDGEKLGMEVSCPEATWPSACPNIAPAENRPAKIVLATLHFLALLVGKNADMIDLPIFESIVIVAKPQVNEQCRHNAKSNASSPTCRPSLGPLCLSPPQAPAEPSGTLVDAALPADELIQRLGIWLVRRCVPHDPAPLAPGSLVGLGLGGGAPNDGTERIFPIKDF
jgi:hypothetical protein